MIFRLIAKIVYLFLLAVETVIAIRFVFKLIGAGDGNVIVRTIYEASDIFIKPFTGVITGDWEIASFFVDVDALIALAIYMILAFVVIEVIKVFSPTAPAE